MKKTHVFTAAKRFLQFLLASFTLFVYRLEVFADLIIPGLPNERQDSGSTLGFLVYLIPILLIVIITVVLLEKRRRNKKEESEADCGVKDTPASK